MKLGFETSSVPDVKPNNTLPAQLELPRDPTLIAGGGRILGGGGAIVNMTSQPIQAIKDGEVVSVGAKQSLGGWGGPFGNSKNVGDIDGIVMEKGKTYLIVEPTQMSETGMQSPYRTTEIKGDGQKGLKWGDTERINFSESKNGTIMVFGGWVEEFADIRGKLGAK